MYYHKRRKAAGSNGNRTIVSSGTVKLGDVVEGKTVKGLGKEWYKNGSYQQYAYFTERSESPQKINTFSFSSGATIYQNARGRCEDAPCCGCCS